MKKATTTTTDYDAFAREQAEMQNDFYSLIYPATRCGTVPREDLAENVRDYLQQFLNQISGLPRTDRYLQIIDDQMCAIHTCSYMIRALFGLRVEIEDNRIIVTDMM